MPSYVRTRLLSAHAFVAGELERLRDEHVAFDESLIDALRVLVPFEHYAFTGIDIDGFQIGNGIVLMTDLPAGLLGAYHDSELLAVDPLLGGLSADAPVRAWFDLAAQELSSDNTRRVAAFFHSHGVPPRTVFGIFRDSHLFGVAVFTRATAFTAEERRILGWFSEKFHEDLSRPILQAFNSRLGITASEQACLQLAARGNTSEDIAASAGFTVETVNFYIKSAMKKLGARNRTQAIADAIRIGLIT